MVARIGDGEVIVAEHAQTEGDFGADGVEVNIVGFFGDAEVGDANGENSVFAPDKHGHGGLGWGDLDSAKFHEDLVGDDQATGGI